MNRFPRLDILPAAQRTLWPQLAAVGRDSFALYGDTAVALYLGHRESVDFDFFAHRSFQPDELLGRYPFLHEAEVLQSQPNTLTVVTAGREAGGVRGRHTFVTLFVVDQGEAVVEFNEGNNRQAECHVIYR